MINRLIHIQDFLNGKTKEELQDAINSERLDFDTSKYQLVPTNQKISGYMVDLTDSYKEEILNMIQESEISRDLLIKIDNILSNGAVFDSKKIVYLYIAGEDIIKGFGQREVTIYRFKDDEGYKEALTYNNGKLIKGSQAMIQRTSEFLENKYENTISRQSYATEILGIEPTLSAYLATRLRFLEDDEFDNTILDISDISQKIMNNLSLKTLNFKNGVQAELFSQNKNEVLNAIFVLLGSNDEMGRIVEKMVGKPTAENIMKTRDILLCGAKQLVKEILLDEQIEEYDDFVNALGEYQEGEYTRNIGIVADVLGLQRDIVQFIVLYGDEQHLQEYLREKNYNMADKSIEESKLPKDIEEKVIEHCLSEFNINTNISRNNIMKVYNAIQKINLSNQAKIDIINSYIENITSKEITKPILKEIEGIGRNKRHSSKEKEKRIKSIIKKI